MIGWPLLEWSAFLASFIGMVLCVWLFLYAIGDYRLTRAVMPDSGEHRYTKKEMIVAPISLLLLVLCTVPSAWSLFWAADLPTPPTPRQILIYAAFSLFPLGLSLIAIIESNYRWTLLRGPRGDK